MNGAHTARHAARLPPPPCVHRRPRVLLALSACGSDSGTSSEVASLGTLATDGASTETTVAVDSQEAILAYAACMRENGVDMADPTFDADGNVTGGGFGPDSGIDPQSTDFQAAQTACGDLIEGVEFGARPRRRRSTATRYQRR